MGENWSSARFAKLGLSPFLRKKQKMKTQNFHVGVPLSLTRICFSIFMMRLVHFSASYYLVVRRANKFFKDYFSQTRDDFLRTFDLKFSGLAEYVNKNFQPFTHFSATRLVYRIASSKDYRIVQGSSM